MLRKLIVASLVIGMTSASLPARANPDSWINPAIANPHYKTTGTGKHVAPRATVAPAFQPAPSNTQNPDGSLTPGAKVFLGVLLGAALIGGAALACQHGGCRGGALPVYRPYPGNCQYYYQRAYDGSLCGYRAAEFRPGGY